MTSTSNNSICSRLRTRRKVGGIYSSNEDMLLDWPSEDYLSTDDEIEQTSAISIISTRISSFANDVQSTNTTLPQPAASSEGKGNGVLENSVQNSDINDIVYDLSKKIHDLPSSFNTDTSSSLLHSNDTSNQAQGSSKELRLRKSASQVRNKKSFRHKKSKSKSLKVEKITSSGLKLVLTRKKDNDDRTSSLSPKNNQKKTKNTKLSNQPEILSERPASDLYEDIENNNVELSLNKKTESKAPSTNNLDRPQVADKHNVLQPPKTGAKSRKNRNSCKKDLLPESADNSTDSMETEARIAMEFPKHNWLVKHIMKEKKLKEECENGNASPGNGRESAAVLKKRKTESQHTSTIATSTKESPATIPLVSLKAVNISSSASPSSKPSIVESQQHNMISIVKPVQYFKENSPKRKRSSSYDEKYSFRETGSPKKNPLGQTLNCKESCTNEDNLEKSFCAVSCSPNNNGDPLDLTLKEKKSNDTIYVLDLSKKSEKESCSEKERESKVDAKKESNILKCYSNISDKEKSFVSVSKESSLEFHASVNRSARKNGSPNLGLEKKTISAEKNMKIHCEGPRSTFEDINRLKTASNLNRSHSKTISKFDSSNCLSKRKPLDEANVSSTNTNRLPPTPNKNHLSQKLTYSRSKSVTDQFNKPVRAISTHPGAKRRNSVLNNNIPIIDVDAIDDKISATISRDAANSITSATKSDMYSSRTHSVTTSGRLLNSPIENRRRSHPELRKVSTSKQIAENVSQPKATQQIKTTSRQSLALRKNSLGLLEHHDSLKFYSKSFGRNATSNNHQPYSSHQQRNPTLLKPPRKDTLTLEYTKRDTTQPHIAAEPKRLDTVFTNVVDMPRKENLGLRGSHHISTMHHPFSVQSSNYPKSLMPARPIITPSSAMRTNFHASSLLVDPRDPKTLQSNAARSQTYIHPLAGHRFRNPTPAYLPKGLLNASPNSSTSQLNSMHQTQQDVRLPLMLPRPSIYNESQSLATFRGSPGGMSINSIPTVGHNMPLHRRTPSIDTFNRPEHAMVNSKLATDAQLAMLSTKEAEQIAVRLQVQKLELENRIHNLKVLEKQIYSSPQYAQKHDQKLFYHSLIDAEKRKLNTAAHHYESQSKIARMAPLHSNRVSHSIVQQAQSASKEREGPSIDDEKCVFCKSKAFFVCSGCRSVWYCSKHCQLDDWPKHNKKCA